MILRREFGGLELGRLFAAGAKITLAAAALAGVTFGVWDVLDDALGRGLLGQIVSLGSGAGPRRARLRRRRQAAAHRRAGAGHAPGPAPRLMLDLPRYLLGVAEILLLGGFAWLGAIGIARPPAARASRERRLIWPRRCWRSPC